MANRTALETFGRSGNPMFRSKAFAADATFRDGPDAGVQTISDRMSLAGAVNKTGILLLLCLVTASYTWNRFFEHPGWQPLATLSLAFAAPVVCWPVH